MSISITPLRIAASLWARRSRRRWRKRGDCALCARQRLPMDETLTRTALDISGRPYLIWRVTSPTQKIGGMDTELFREFFQAFAQNAGITLHIELLYGENSHHIAGKLLSRGWRGA